MTRQRTIRFDIDVERLRKGDKISVKEVEKLTGEREGTPKYGLRMMALKTYVDAEMARLGRTWTTCVQRGALCVLTDAEASVYNARQFDLALDRAEGAFTRNAAVDVGHLDAGQRTKHDRSLTLQGAVLTAVAAASKRVKSGYGAQPRQDDDARRAFLGQ